jgi:transcriptional regulator with XRE-family HTH domain
MATTTNGRGLRLRAIREGKGWSRQTLSRKSGVSEATVARAELYGQDVKLSTWDAWAAALDVPVSELVADGEAA